MVATYDHEDLESWFYMTCPTAGTKNRYPDETQGNNIMVAVENSFIARTGKAISTSDAKHVQLCQWLAELEMRKWARVHNWNADSYSSPGGSITFTTPTPSFTWEQFDAMVEAIKGGGTVGEANPFSHYDADLTDDR